MTDTTKHRLSALGWGAIGIALVLLGVHVYQDHRTHHALVAAIVQAQQAGQLQIGVTEPTPAPVPVPDPAPSPAPE